MPLVYSTSPTLQDFVVIKIGQSFLQDQERGGKGQFWVVIVQRPSKARTGLGARALLARAKRGQGPGLEFLFYKKIWAWGRAPPLSPWLTKAKVILTPLPSDPSNIPTAHTLGSSAYTLGYV